MHSTERGGAEMLMELAYRLVVEETPFIQQIRNNVITFITPVIEVDGRERVVDTFYYNAQARGRRAGGQLGMPYWGKYVAHDNNRDGMGQFLAMTKNVEKFATEWKPTVLHDLHEAAQLLYVSTGTGPYNEQLDPLTINEWWMFAQNDVMEMTKRGVPGVWTYGFYDGWTPNYMFFVAHGHNATGRFYEVNSFNPGTAVTYPGSAGGAERCCGVLRVPQVLRVLRVRARREWRGAGAAAGGRGGAAAAGAGGGRGGAAVGGAQPGRRRSRRRARPEPRVVPSESGSGQRGLGPARAREHEPVGGALRAQLRREGQGALARELLGQEPHRGGSRTERPDVRWVIPADQHSKANAAEAVTA